MWILSIGRPINERFGMAAQSLSEFQIIILLTIALGALDVMYGASITQSILGGAVAVLGCFALRKHPESRTIQGELKRGKETLC